MKFKKTCKYVYVYIYMCVNTNTYTNMCWYACKHFVHIPHSPMACSTFAT